LKSGGAYLLKALLRFRVPDFMVLNLEIFGDKSNRSLPPEFSLNRGRILIRQYIGDV